MKYYVQPKYKKELGYCVKGCLCYGGNCACVGPSTEGHVAEPGDVIIDVPPITGE